MATATDKVELTPRQRFLQTGARRVNNALEMMAPLGKMATSQYEYTEEDVKQIENALNTKTKEVCDILLGTREEVGVFSFNEVADGSSEE